MIMETQEKLVPSMRFKDFKDSWSIRIVGDFLTSYRGGAALTPSDFRTAGNHLVFPKKYIVPGGRLPKERALTFCSQRFFEGNQNSVIDSSYLITALRDLVPSGPSIGFIVQYESNERYILAQGVYGLKIDEDQIDRRFLIQFSNTPNYRAWMRRIKVGSTQVHIRIGDFKRLIINLPTLPEQQKIADFLTAVDGRIQQLIQKKALLEEYKKGVMQQLFSQAIRFKDDNGSNFPDWEEKRLGEVSDVRDGTHESPKYQAHGYPLVTSKNLKKNGSIDMENVDLISEEDYRAINKRSRVEGGDIVFGMIGTIGNPVIVSEAGFAIKNVALIKEKDGLQNKYLIYYLDSANIARQFHVENTGGTQKFIALGVIRKLHIHTPSLEEQTKVANFLSAIDRKINNVTTQITETQNFKRGLLQQMFV